MPDNDTGREQKVYKVVYRTTIGGQELVSACAYGPLNVIYKEGEFVLPARTTLLLCFESLDTAREFGKEVYGEIWEATARSTHKIDTLAMRARDIYAFWSWYWMCRVGQVTFPPTFESIPAPIGTLGCTALRLDCFVEFSAYSRRD